VTNFSASLSSYYILGALPADTFVHFLVGAIVSVTLLKKTKLSFGKVAMVVCILALGKELYDQGVMTNTLEENIKDFSATVFYPVILYLIRFFLKNNEENPSR